MFKGKFVYIIETSLPAERFKMVQDVFTSHEGTIVDEINDRDVLLLADSSGLDKITEFLKIPSKRKSSKPLCDVKWIFDSIKAGKLKDINDYLISSEAFNPKTKEPLTAEKESDSQADLDQSFENTKFECQRKTPLNHCNKEIISLLEKISKHRYLTSDTRSELSYNKAIAALKSYPRDLRSFGEAQQIKGFGPKISGLVKEFQSLGKISGIEEMWNDPKIKSVEEFTKIHGVGPKIAGKWWSMGIRSIDDLNKAIQTKKVVLKADQLIGLKYMKDFGIQYLIILLLLSLIIG